ncbi:regulator of chromosome condensation 1/beta-lactamase-inhibitor protein II, partial [Truncatella angustata]
RKTATAAKPAAKTRKAPAKAVNGTAATKTKKQAEKAAGEGEKEAQAESSAPGARRNNKRKDPEPGSESTSESEPESEQEEKTQKKRKQRDDDEPAPVVKKVRTAAVPTVGKPINNAPVGTLDVFVFGEGTSGELGLGSRKYDGKKPIDVKRPRINHNLDANKVGVVQLSCGGMHVIALTHDNKILTWGVNDDRALGRDTTWDGGVRDVDNEGSDSEDDDDDTGMNPHESTPGEVDFTDIAIDGTKFVQVAATDSASFVLTEDGRVYGWGTFRGSDGIIGFSDGVRIQQVPILIMGLKNITRLAAGANHVLALDLDGKVFSWGSGGQYQLGRKAITRGKNSGLKPEPCGRFTRRHHAIDIATGSYHSFYTDNHGQIWAWGLNNYSQTGHNDNRGEDDAMVLVPRPVESLAGKKIASIDGGEHHSVAATTDGALLTWGRVDGHQVGQPQEVHTEANTVYDGNGRPRILIEPTPIQDINATFVATGTDTSFALTGNGQVYSWGFSANYQTGQGTSDDVEEPALIDNTAIHGRKIIWAGAGGQYSIVAASP